MSCARRPRGRGWREKEFTTVNQGETVCKTKIWNDPFEGVWDRRKNMSQQKTVHSVSASSYIVQKGGSSLSNSVLIREMKQGPLKPNHNHQPSFAQRLFTVTKPTVAISANGFPPHCELTLPQQNKFSHNNVSKQKVEALERHHRKLIDLFFI